MLSVYFNCQVLLTHWPVAYLKLLDEFLFLCLLCVLLLFWAVYTMDKVAKNEPWERNTKYYDKVILLVVFGIIMSKSQKLKDPSRINHLLLYLFFFSRDFRDLRLLSELRAPVQQPLAD